MAVSRMSAATQHWDSLLPSLHAALPKFPQAPRENSGPREQAALGCVRSTSARCEESCSLRGIWLRAWTTQINNIFSFLSRQLRWKLFPGPFKASSLFDCLCQLQPPGAAELPAEQPAVSMETVPAWRGTTRRMPSGAAQPDRNTTGSRGPKDRHDSEQVRKAKEMTRHGVENRGERDMSEIGTCLWIQRPPPTKTKYENRGFKFI